MPLRIAEEIKVFRYREKFRMSYNELLHEPAAEIRKAMLVWSLDSERDKLESRKANI
ncbi:hypothetical protein GCM10009648_07410 [Tsukamurella spumae]